MEAESIGLEDRLNDGCDQKQGLRYNYQVFGLGNGVNVCAIY